MTTTSTIQMLMRYNAWANRAIFEDGLDNALEDKPRPGAESKLDEGQEAHLTALEAV